MLASILYIINGLLKIFGMREERRREIVKAVLRDSLAYEKDSKASSRLRGEYKEMLEEIRKERQIY